MPKVTVIIPTYNYAQYIIEGIDSVLAQATEQMPIEIIVVDDGSTDETQVVLDNYIVSEKIRYFYQKNQGKAAATRKAVSLATGKYIFNLDADDYFLPHKLKTFVNIFENYPSVIHVGSAAKVIDDKGNHLSTESIDALWANRPVNGIALATYFLKHNTLWAGGSTYAVRADVLKALTIPDAVDMYLDEYLILGILSQGDSFCFTTPLSIWRVHGKNYSNMNTQQLIEKNKRLLTSSSGTLAALRQYSELPSTLFKLYEFKHQTRLIASMEDNQSKSIVDILQYGKRMVALRKEGVAFFKRYTSFNRLFPTPVLHFLKRQMQ